MSKENQYYDITDAFLALRDLDDDAVEGMLRESRVAKHKRIHEGKAFSIHGTKDMDAAQKFVSEDVAEGDQIEVIDVDADSVEHIKKNSEYIGQGILSCNRCKANRFIDMDLLNASEEDEELYNTDDECPHCHDAGAGYTLIGQVGKVQKQEEEPAAEATEEQPQEEAEVENDAVNSDEATFDNDLEPESDAAEEEQSEEGTSEESELDLPEVETFEEEPEDDGMETDTSEDELDDLDLPTLGDEYDQDDTAEDDDNVKESLNEEVELNHYAEEAWMMNRVISYMNNESAYFGSWLYIWPDGESREECAYDFGDRESFEELEETFIRIYKHYHNDGLYDAPSDVVNYAHKMDSKLSLAKIENIEAVKPHVTESYDCTVAGDVFKAILDPEKIDTIIILNVVDDNEPTTVYKGSREDVPMNVIGSTCKSFDVADGYLSCNIDCDVENTNRPLNKALECFSDEKTDKILLWDQASGEEVFSGNKEEACKRFGNCEFISFETPAVVRITISNPGVLSVDEIEDNDHVETDNEKLIKKIIDANNLSQYKTKNPNTNEYWIKECIEEADDLELIYETFVKPTENKNLIKEFKQVTGYTNVLEDAYDAGLEAARSTLHEGFSTAEFNEFTDLCKQLGLNSFVDVAKFAEKEGGVSDKALLDALRNKAAKISENESLDPVKAEVAEFEAEQSKATCDNCGMRLNDGGTCPRCDDGEEDFRESVRSFKNRKELAAAIEECKNNSKPYTIRRSLTEGCRYDLVTEEIEDEDNVSLVPAVQGEIEIVDDIPQEMPAEYSPAQVELMNQIHRVAVDTADAIKRHYGIEGDPQLIVADIIRDLKLISGDISVDELGSSPVDVATKALFKSYTDFYNFIDELISAETGTEFRTTPEMKLKQAFKMLDGPNFSTANIDRMIGSTAFLSAAQSGQVPYIGADDIPLLTEALNARLESDVCESCGKAPCECDEETLEVDTDRFDHEMNEYFNSAYEDTVVYTTTDGSVEEDGTIMLEGVIQYENVMKPISFTLTPKNMVTESVEAVLSETFTVTNNLSEEVFEFKFDK